MINKGSVYPLVVRNTCGVIGQNSPQLKTPLNNSLFVDEDGKILMNRINRKVNIYYEISRDNLQTLVCKFTIVVDSKNEVQLKAFTSPEEYEDISVEMINEHGTYALERKSLTS